MSTLSDHDAKPLFERGPTLGARLFVLATVSLALMFFDARFEHLRSIRQALAVAVYPIRVVVDLPYRVAGWFGDGLRSHQVLVHENRVLRETQLATSIQLQRLAALEAENARLRALMDSSAKVADRVLVSEIMAVDLDPYRHRIVVNKGERDGAFLGQALLDATGIVGQITRAEPFSSEAILISDASHALPVEINRNGLRTIAVGTGDIARLVLPFLPNNADIEVGDLLVSSGLGGSFPAGYPVATISSVTRDPGEPFAAIAATPTAALNRSREVLLVWSSAAPAVPAVQPAKPGAGGESEQLARAPRP